MRPERQLNFAYGSNMNPDQMSGRCPSSRVAGIARLDDHAFRINGRGVATVVPTSGRSVHGVLWELTPEDELELDRREGVRNGTYAKREVVVVRPNGSTATAIAYVAADSIRGAPRPGYLERILAGARRFGLPDDYVTELESWASVAG